MSIFGPGFRIAGDIRDVVRASSMPHSHLRDRLTAAIFLTLAVDIIASFLLYAVEHDVKGSDIHTYRDAFYFVSSQLTTMSAAMANPVTRAGEVLCLVIDLYAITVVASVAGMFGGFFAHRSAELRAAAESKADDQAS